MTIAARSQSNSERQHDTLGRSTLLRSTGRDRSRPHRPSLPQQLTGVRDTLLGCPPIAIQNTFQGETWKRQLSVSCLCCGWNSSGSHLQFIHTPVTPVNSLLPQGGVGRSSFFGLSVESFWDTALVSSFSFSLVQLHMDGCAMGYVRRRSKDDFG